MKDLTVMEKMPSSYSNSFTIKASYPAVYGMESPNKKYIHIFYHLILDSRLKKNNEMEMEICCFNDFQNTHLKVTLRRRPHFQLNFFSHKLCIYGLAK